MQNRNMRDNVYREYPTRLYRNSEEVREDISEIKRRIGEINSSFAIREILFDILSDGRERKPSEWIYDLEALVLEAETAHRKLGELREELSFLEAELCEIGCRMGM